MLIWPVPANTSVATASEAYWGRIHSVSLCRFAKYYYAGVCAYVEPLFVGAGRFTAICRAAVLFSIVESQIESVGAVVKHFSSVCLARHYAVQFAREDAKVLRAASVVLPDKIC